MITRRVASRRFTAVFSLNSSATRLGAQYTRLHHTTLRYDRVQLLRLLMARAQARAVSTPQLHVPCVLHYEARCATDYVLQHRMDYV